MKGIYILLLVSITFAAYSEEDAIRYVWASSFAYCNDLGVDNCGNSTKMKDFYGFELVEYKQTGLIYDFVNLAILKDDKR